MATPISIVPRQPRAAAQDPERSRLDRPRLPGTWIQLAILASAVFIVAALVHAQTLHFKFLTTWDDPSYIANNPWIRGLTLENIRFAFTTPYFANYLPLHLVSYMVDYQFWGLNPFGYRLQSLLLVALNASLAFLLVRRLFRSLALGFVAALLFAVHPAQVEAIAWISIRKDLLSTLFLLLTVILYDEATRDRLRPWVYAASVVMYLLGLLSKVSISTLPLFLLVLDLTRRWDGRSFSWKRAIATKVPYLVLAAILVVVNNMAQVKTDLPYTHQPLQYLMVKGEAICRYLGLLTGILEGRPMYDPPWLGGIHPPIDLAGLLLPLVVFAFAFWRRLRALTLGVAWIFFLLLPVLAFPLITYMADRYLYAPSLGFCWILAAGILWVAGRVRSNGGRVAAAVVLTVIPFTLFTMRTARYEALWGDPEALWRYASHRAKDVRASSNLAQTLTLKRRYGEAEQLYLKLSGLNSTDVWAGLATVYIKTGRFDEAQEAMDKAVLRMDAAHKRDNERADILCLRAMIEWARDDREAAIRDWVEAARLDPKNQESRARLRRAGVEPPPPS
jgi:protein O-mannosyl-transferase